ncbi:sulfite exporter TauE/SafE family protein [Corynebacterium callunae]|uniref:TSUP family transporter n=1 Tax=Corynebacterium callunae TaxID=1721 RepID=UPI00398237FF
MLALFTIGVIVAFGACLQRVSGLGLGLVAGPVMAVIIGPIEGILVVNVISVFNAAISTASVHKDIDWPQFRIIAIMLILGAIPATVLLKYVPVSVVLTIVALILLASLSLVTFAQKKIPHFSGRIPAVVAGIVSGFSNSLSGASGPVMTIYAQATRWEQKPFAATLQPVFFSAALVSILVKALFGTAHLPDTSLWVWPVCVVSMVLGNFLGARMAPHIAKGTARKFALVVAFGGAFVVLYKGLSGLFA